MARISASLSVDSQPRPDLLAAALEVEVDEDRELATALRLRAATLRDDRGHWRFLDDADLKPWAQLAVTATVDGAQEEIFSGYLTQLRAHVDPDEGRSWVELVGLDASALMNVEEKIRDWPNMKDSDVATAIFGEYGLAASVEDTGIVHDVQASTIIQRESDIQFLRRLAQRNGFECGVRGAEGIFRPPALQAPPLPVLAVHFGGESNVTLFDARWDAARPTAVEAADIDPLAKQVLTVTAPPATVPPLGRDAAAALATPSPATRRRVVRHAVTTAVTELTRLCRAVQDDSEWFIEAHGEVDAAVYGAVLRAGALVPVKGAGEAFSGVYQLSTVRHVFAVERYLQRFTARRNAAAPLPGDFAAAGSLL